MICVRCKMTIVAKRGDMCKGCAPTATTRARVREAKMAGRLLEWAAKGFLPKYTLWNKANQLADSTQCGRYRPDFLFEWAEGVLILEYDEQMHSDRAKRCELVRMAEVSHGYGGRPVCWIRFNPDAFKLAGTTLFTTLKKREAVLLKLLQDKVGDADYDHFMTVCYVCYNKPQKTSEDDLVQTFKFTSSAAYEAWVEATAPA
jgi:hypothetical protein